MYDWICHNGFVPIVIATKSDKLKRSQIPQALKNIDRVLREKSQYGKELTLTVIPFSGFTKDGRDAIVDILDGYLNR